MWCSSLWIGKRGRVRRDSRTGRTRGGVAGTKQSRTGGFTLHIGHFRVKSDELAPSLLPAAFEGAVVRQQFMSLVEKVLHERHGRADTE